MWKNAKECFAEMSKNRKMQNGLGSRMMQLDSLELQKSIEKFRYGKRKTTFYEVTEHNGLKGIGMAMGTRNPKPDGFLLH